MLQSSTSVVGFADGAQYDLATGLGSINVTNLLSKWATVRSASTNSLWLKRKHVWTATRR